MKKNTAVPPEIVSERACSGRLPRRWRKFYAFTTENLAGYLPLLPPPRKVLTVCGSGDHLLNLALLGATEFLVFDINPAARFWLELKLAGVMRLTWREFKSFFLRRTGGKRALAWSTYLDLRGYLSAEARSFFDRCYRRTGFSGQALRESALFDNRFDRDNLKTGSNLYLRSERRFLALKRSLPLASINFSACPLQELPRRLRGKKFDAVFLSNIADYARDLYPGQRDYLERFVAGILVKLTRALTVRGYIAAAYVYNARSRPPFHSALDDPACRSQVLDQHNLKWAEAAFGSVIPGRTDRVVILTR